MRREGQQTACMCQIHTVAVSRLATAAAAAVCDGRTCRDVWQQAQCVAELVAHDQGLELNQAQQQRVGHNVELPGNMGRTGEDRGVRCVWGLGGKK